MFACFINIMVRHAFDFPLLPEDVQRLIVTMMTPLCRYLFFSAAKSNFNLFIEEPPVIGIATRSHLLRLAVRTGRSIVIAYMLPEAHWITRKINRDPEHFWNLLGISDTWPDLYQNSEVRMRILVHLRFSTTLGATALSNIIKFGVSRLIVDDFYLIPLVWALEEFPDRRRMSQSALSALINCMVRRCRYRLLDILLQQYSTLSRVVLNSAIRSACFADTVERTYIQLLKYF